MKKDHMIKLFGKEIIPLTGTISSENTPAVGGGKDSDFQMPEDNIFNRGAMDDAEEQTETEKDPPSGVIEPDSGNNREEKEEDDDVSDQKTLKKPDKIIPCPRCNSMDTKFCYHNNYNVNQPRHFCKSCQRYWTSGGTMRNVPVGAGRRKNKNAAAACRHITVSEALNIQNGTVLSFGPESMKAPNEIPNGLFYRIPPNNGENGDDCSSRSSITTSNSIEDGFAKNRIIPPPPPQEPTTIMRNFNGFHPHQIPYFSYPLPTFYQPMPVLPAPFWNCGYPNSWTAAPWLSASSPVLGKHSREGDLIRPKSTNAGVKDLEGANLIPKSLRIDYPDEAAKSSSSIWTTLGIKDDNMANRRSLFKGFESKDGEKNKKKETASPTLMANPAAMSRSVRLQEGA